MQQLVALGPSTVLFIVPQEVTGTLFVVVVYLLFVCVTLSLTIINYFLNSVTDQSIVQDPKQSLQTQQQCLLDIIVASAVVNFLCVVDALLNVLYHIVASGPVQRKDNNNACLLSNRTELGKCTQFIHMLLLCEMYISICYNRVVTTDYCPAECQSCW